jgi:hypothetical protein
MKEVPYWRWYTWNLQRTKKTATRYHMDEATALAHHPEAEKVPNSMVVRREPEDESEVEYTSPFVKNRKPR